MPAPWGLTSAGFNPMRLPDVVAELQDRARAAFGQNVRVDDQSVLGQIIGVVAEPIADVWAEAEKAYAAAYPGGASGAALADLVALAAIEPLAATYSQVTLTLTGTNGTIIPINSVTADEEGKRWVHTTAATISGGTATATAQPESTGPVQGLAGTITEIVTPVSGWISVTNLLDAEVGFDVESDAGLRTRYSLTMRAGGGSAVEAIQAAILRLDDVTECLIVENESWIPDADGRPGKSFETVVRGGDDQEIVETIWFNKPAGIETYGSETGSALDNVGDPHTINFSRPTQRDIYFGVDIEYEGGVLDAQRDAIEDEVVEAILEYGGTFTIGQDVNPFKFIQRIDSTGIEALTLRVGLAPNPTSTTTLVIPRTHLADFDSSRIAFVRLN